MIETAENPLIDDTNRQKSSVLGRIQWLFARSIAWLTTASWRATVDWPSVRPVLIRCTGHLAVVLLALAAVLLARLDLPQAAADLGQVSVSTSAEAELPEAPSRQPGVKSAIVTRRSYPVDLQLAAKAQPLASAADETITRLALPHTIIPERPRVGVFTYTVQAGDTVFGISESFGVTPYTIYWANSETLNDNPHMLQIGMKLHILPIDGVYHTVSEGETLEGIAEEYGVEPEAINNEWNQLEWGKPLPAGTRLVIPGGEREFVVWQLPKYTSSGIQGGGNAGLCAGPFSGGVIGSGFFAWPVSGRRISGWVFRDPRNPAHGGVDFGLSTGDPIFAADNGVIVYAGWNTWGYGNLVVIDHGNGWQTWYAHLSQVNVYCGQAVWQGNVIGLGGSTGRSTGPHLHFEIRYEGSVVNPLNYLP